MRIVFEQWSDRKKNLIHILIFLTFICTLLTIYFTMEKTIILKKTYSPIPLSGSLVYQIDSVKVKDNKVIFDGFAFRKGTDSNLQDKWIVLLHNMETGENIYMKTKRKIRKDVNDYFKCEFDYSSSGFEASTKKRSIDLEKGKYQVYLCYMDLVTDLRKFVALEEYLIEGKLINVDITKNELLDFSGSGLDVFLKDAELRACQCDYGVCVYQKKGDLYWIVDRTFQFKENEKTLIQFQMNTTQVEKLPQERLDEGSYWGNSSFYFEEYEIVGDFSGYRVAKMRIPKDYSVTDIETGYHDGTRWIWKQYFFAKYSLLWNEE